jgi:hypothetical protein
MWAAYELASEQSLNFGIIGPEYFLEKRRVSGEKVAVDLTVSSRPLKWMFPSLNQISESCAGAEFFEK